MSTIKTFKLKLTTKRKKTPKVEEEVEVAPQRGTKRKWCGKEIVNNEEVRRKNREAQKKSRKKRKLAKMQMEADFKALRERNESLTRTVNTLTRENLDRTEENKELKKQNEELLEQVETLRASHEKMQRDLAQLQANGSKSVETKEPSAVFRTADSGMSQQRTLAENLVLMLSIQLLATHCPTYLQALLQTCSKNKIPLAILLTLILKNEITLPPTLLFSMMHMTGSLGNENLISGGRRNLSAFLAYNYEHSNMRWKG